MTNYFWVLLTDGENSNEFDDRVRRFALCDEGLHCVLRKAEADDRQLRRFQHQCGHPGEQIGVETTKVNDQTRIHRGQGEEIHLRTDNPVLQNTCQLTLHDIEVIGLFVTTGRTATAYCVPTYPNQRWRSIPILIPTNINFTIPEGDLTSLILLDKLTQVKNTVREASKESALQYCWTLAHIGSGLVWRRDGPRVDYTSEYEDDFERIGQYVYVVPLRSVRIDADTGEVNSTGLGWDYVGTFIAPVWIITTASCFPENRENVIIQIAIPSESRTRNQITYSERYYPHPKYIKVKDDTVANYDIGLVEVRSRIKISDYLSWTFMTSQLKMKDNCGVVTIHDMRPENIELKKAIECPSYGPKTFNYHKCVVAREEGKGIINHCEEYIYLGVKLTNTVLMSVQKIRSLGFISSTGLGITLKFELSDILTATTIVNIQRLGQLFCATRHQSINSGPHEDTEPTYQYINTVTNGVNDKCMLMSEVLYIHEHGYDKNS
ncbi:hypothetical protein C0J52_22733 [Blattella germanica]|nr:hypothetical protein C0J52_22733 [Blattella germanica]